MEFPDRARIFCIPILVRHSLRTELTYVFLFTVSYDGRAFRLYCVIR
jgi:hypothetical protein